jgi:hypothetical protein
MERNTSAHHVGKRARRVLAERMRFDEILRRLRVPAGLAPGTLPGCEECEMGVCDEDVLEGAAGEPGLDGGYEVLGCALRFAEQRMRDAPSAQRYRDPETLGCELIECEVRVR